MMSLLIKRFLLPSKLIFQHTFIPFGRNWGGGGSPQFNQTMDRCFNALKKNQPLFFFYTCFILRFGTKSTHFERTFFSNRVHMVPIYYTYKKKPGYIKKT